MLTNQQLEQRRRFVGSSDIGAIIGVDPYRNAGDVWLAKTGRLPATEANSVINRGVELEPYVISLFEAERGVHVHRDVWVQGDDVCASNLDGAMVPLGAVIPVDSPTARIPDAQLQPFIESVVEAKTSNFGRDWNQETGQIPMLPLTQVSFQIGCTGPQCTHGFVPALIPEFQRFKFLSPLVKRNDEFWEELKIAAHEFMEYVRKDIRPPDAVPHLESLKRMRREPESVISLGDEAAELWEQYAAAGDRARGAEADKEEHKRQILAALGDAEAGRLPDGREIRFMEQNGGRHCDIDRLQVLSPDLYEQLVSQSRFRVLRLKKAATGRKR